MKGYDILAVKLTGGYMKKRQLINIEKTVLAVYKRYKESGRIDAVKMIRREQKTHIFWDSDVFKWLESAAYSMYLKKSEHLKKLADEVIGDIEKNQAENGYFNSYFQVYEPEKIFTDRTQHELYCAGHLFEAAYAFSHCLKDDRLLKVSEKYADYINLRFVINQDTGFKTPGHEEIELALIKLYELTGKQKYIDLAAFFLENRGRTKEGRYDFAGISYHQDECPIREMRVAGGHAVRALYLYTAMAKYARIKGDVELKEACEALFFDIANKKQYVTGGVGSDHLVEIIGPAYDLPNFTAYSETCAAIAMALYCNEMSEINLDSKYADVFERVLYNALSAGVSMDGKKFFYVNPLEMRKNLIEFNDSRPVRHSFPIAERVENFECSCCPPNIARFFSNINSFIYKEYGDSLIVNQYISSRLKERGEDIEMASGFPFGGQVKIEIKKTDKKKLLLRKPYWCDKVECSANYELKKGYMEIDMREGDTVKVNFKMRPKLIYPSALIAEDAGKKAVAYGPLIMAAEEIDNFERLSQIKLESFKNFKKQREGDFFFITFDALKEKESEELYSDKKPIYEKIRLKLLPYCQWNNRGKGNMLVWLR